MEVNLLVKSWSVELNGVPIQSFKRCIVCKEICETCSDKYHWTCLECWLPQQRQKANTPILKECVECGSSCDRKCSRGCGTYFCSRKCQKISWNTGHKKICKKLLNLQK